jgi:tRNA threonylcarbamoyladenosine biosynthesis protein TsaE
MSTANNKPTIKVVIAIILNETYEQVLISLRQAHQEMGGFWEFPGGKIEPDESSEQSLRRELEEEVVIKSSKHQLLLQLYCDCPHKILVLDVWVVLEFSPEPRGCENQEIQWISLADLYPSTRGISFLPRSYAVIAELPAFLEQLKYEGPDALLIKKSVFMLERYFADEHEQMQWGAKLAQILHPQEKLTIFLEGTLGAGKTTLVRGFLRGLGYQAAVKSPTYTLLETYELEDQRIYHFDLYRLADPEELEYMGIRDYFTEKAICLVEWPEKGMGILPSADIYCWLEVLDSGRRIYLEARSELGNSLLENLRDL